MNTITNLIDLTAAEIDIRKLKVRWTIETAQDLRSIYGGSREERAYLKWEAAGKPTGRDMEFWIEAELF